MSIFTYMNSFIDLSTHIIVSILIYEKDYIRNLLQISKCVIFDNL